MGENVDDSIQANRMTEYFQATMTILSLVNPVICASIFAKIVAGQSTTTKIVTANKATLAIVVVLCLSALAGAQVLKMFGISLSAFQVAGGMVLVWMGFLMLRGNGSPTSARDATTDDASPLTSASLAPLIMFAASPGTITGVITLSISRHQTEFPVTSLVAIVVAMSVTWVVMVMVARSAGEKKPGLLHDISTRFMGLIVLAMGVQFALTGLNLFFNPS